MAYAGYSDNNVTEKQFSQIYKKIREMLITGKLPDADKCTIVLGGQPGAGKSSFYSMKEELLDYIAINGDEYRRFHPNYQNIIKSDPEHYAERTQGFSNAVTERLIEDLGSNGYNLVIEGTLRNPAVPIKTCEYLQSHGYSPELVVVACDAEVAWQSTLTRAELQRSQGISPRLVPIDIYNSTVNQIPRSLAEIEKRDCFNRISLLNRDGVVLYDSRNGGSAVDTLRKELDLNNWNSKFSFYEKEFIKEKIAILQSALEERLR